MPKKLLFISSTNLTTNPRLLKELKLAVDLGYKVDFIGFKLANWSDKIDETIIENIKANFHYLPITRDNFVSWLISSLIEKLAQKLYPLLKNSLKINAYAHSKRSFLLSKHLKNKNKKYDLIVAHTLPTLYPAYKFAKRTNTKFTFDIEDYHPGEFVAIDVDNEKARRFFLMKTILPKASYITYASPLIGKYSLKLLDSYPKNKHQLISNSFSQTEFQHKENDSYKVKFVWFSQNIAAGRGLELVLPALKQFSDKVELYLIGNLYPAFYDTFLSKYSNFIKIEEPLSQKALNLKLSNIDIGLALELNTADFNRQICLTNKIFAYAHSGLYILATNTQAQVQFMKEHEYIGALTAQTTEAFEKSIKEIINNIDEIRKNKQKRFEYAQQLAWENEREKLVSIWS